LRDTGPALLLPAHWCSGTLLKQGCLHPAAAG